MRLKRMFALLLAMVVVFSLTLTATAEADTQVDFGISNPKIVTDSSMKAGQKTTWDCIYFGSYPQAEVVDSSDYGAVGSDYLQDGDIIVDSSLYAQLDEATWTDDTVTIDGYKYYRMKKSNATYSKTGSTYYYDWSTSSATYHYFKFEPVKWRILSIDDAGHALILADKALDDQYYDPKSISSVTWETSSMRTWLNGVFMNRAFTVSEQETILSTALENKDNNRCGTDGGNDTTDKIFLLAESDIYTEGYNSNLQYVTYGGKALEYGFQLVALFGMKQDDVRVQLLQKQWGQSGTLVRALKSAACGGFVRPVAISVQLAM